MTETLLKFDPGTTHGAPGLYLTGEDNIKITTWGALAGAVVTVEARLITPAGELVPIVETTTPSSDRSAVTKVIPLREGFLTTVQLRATTGAAIRGHIFAIVEVVRGTGSNAQPLGALLSDYVTAAGRLAWPGAPIRSSTEGPGRLRLIIGTDPAAGTEIVETVPTGARWRLRVFTYVLTASGVAANRRPVLVIDTGLSIFFRTFSNVAQTAGQLVNYHAGVGMPFFLTDTLTYHLPLPCDMVLPAGARIRTVTAAIDAGDDYSSPIYSVEEWLEP